MTFPLNGPKLKIERAQLKLNELESTSRQFFNHESLSLVVEHDAQIGNKVAKIRLDAPLPEIIHILAGEIIYHLRSSLDQIAVAFGRMSSARPNVKNIYFPTGGELARLPRFAKERSQRCGRRFDQADH